MSSVAGRGCHVEAIQMLRSLAKTSLMVTFSHQNVHISSVVILYCTLCFLSLFFYFFRMVFETKEFQC